MGAFSLASIKALASNGRALPHSLRPGICSLQQRLARHPAGVKADTKGVKVDTKGVKVDTKGVKVNTKGVKLDTKGVKVDTNVARGSH
eukprot:1175585-Prorocentrum_minimum.AAC.1